MYKKYESDKFIERIMDHFKDYGYGLWAVDIKEIHQFIGRMTKCLWCVE